MQALPASCGAGRQKKRFTTAMLRRVPASCGAGQGCAAAHRFYEAYYAGNICSNKVNDTGTIRLILL